MPRISCDADAVRNEQAKVLHAIPPPMPEDVLTRAVRGQYGAGEIDGREVAPYRTEPLVATDLLARDGRAWATDDYTD